MPIGDPTPKTKLLVHLAAAGQCCFPDCDEKSRQCDTIVGEVAHICAPGPGGPRYDPSLPPEQVDTFENLLLLCRKHHKIVDGDPGTYTAEILREWKRVREAGDAEPSVLRQILDALLPDIPKDRWWEAPGAPRFRPSLASSRPGDRSWTFSATLRQEAGDEVRLQARFRGCGVNQPLAEPANPRANEWRLPDAHPDPNGAPDTELGAGVFALERRFWWRGAYRHEMHVWERMKDFQESEARIQRWSQSD